MKYQLSLHITVLLCILFGGLFTFWYAAGNVGLQLTVGIITAISYVVWGIMHHHMMGTLHKKIVVEYVLMGTIAVILLVTLAI